MSILEAVSQVCISGVLKVVDKTGPGLLQTICRDSLCQALETYSHCFEKDYLPRLDQVIWLFIVCFSNNMLYPKEDKETKVLLYAVSMKTIEEDVKCSGFIGLCADAMSNYIFNTINKFAIFSILEQRCISECKCFCWHHVILPLIHMAVGRSDAVPYFWFLCDLLRSKMWSIQ